MAGYYKNQKYQKKQEQKEQRWSTAPYNFIPFEEFAAIPIEEKEEVSHNRFYSMHSEKQERYTGKITYELKSLTELFVGGDRENENGERLFFQDQDNFIIPGSTIRGLVRSNASILSFARPEFIDDQRFLYRSFADKSKVIRNQYMDVMRGAESSRGKQSFKQSVKAGYFYWATKDKLCCIPAPEFGETGRNYVKVHERDLRDKSILQEQNHYMYVKPVMKYGEFLRKKGYQLSQSEKREYLGEYQNEIKKYYNRNYTPYGNNPFRGVHVSFHYRNNKVCDLNEGSYDGILLNSEYINGKTAHYLVNYYELEDFMHRTDELVIDMDLVRSFEADLERNQLQNKKLKQGFYNLPYDKNGKRKIGREHAKLFFYGQKENGEIFGFGATPYFRVFHKYSVMDGVRQKQFEVEKEKQIKDYVPSMFGYTNEGSKDNKHYEGRVSFGNCKMEKHGNRLSVPRKVILAGPKPTAFQMYAAQTDKSVANLNTYSTKGNKIRGRKFYWKREEASVPAEHSQMYELDESANKEVQIIPDFKKALIPYEGKKTEQNTNRQEESKTVSLKACSHKVKVKNIEKTYICTLNEDIKKKIRISAKKENDKVKTKFIPVLPYQTFYGEIYFENLSIDELGLLLMAIRKNRHCCENIGSGKPYGFGKVRFQNIRLYREDKEQSFLQFEPQEQEDKELIIQAKKCFVEKMNGLLKGINNKTYDQQESIKLYNRVKRQTGVSDNALIDYMDFAYYKLRYPLLDVYELFDMVKEKMPLNERNEEGQENTESVGDMQKGASEESIMALQSKFGNVRKNKKANVKKR